MQPELNGGDGRLTFGYLLDNHRVDAEIDRVGDSVTVVLSPAKPRRSTTAISVPTEALLMETPAATAQRGVGRCRGADSRLAAISSHIRFIRPPPSCGLAADGAHARRTSADAGSGSSEPRGNPAPMATIPFDFNGDDAVTGDSMWMHVISIEPAFDQGEGSLSAVPFQLKPYGDAFGDGGPTDSRTITALNPLPTGSVTVVQ